MNKNIIILAALMIGAFSGIKAQTSDEEAEAIINLLGVQKKEAIEQLVVVSGQDSVTFWKLYDEYQKLNKVNAKARISLYERTAMAYNHMSPTLADSLATQYFTNRKEMENTLETYYRKIKSATNALVAFEFYQAEVYMLTMIRATIMEQIPTYGQLHKTMEN